MSYLRVLQQFTSAALILAGGLCLSSVAQSDPLDDVEYLPATAAEKQFIQEVIARSTAAIPALDGWELKRSTYMGQRLVREDEPITIFARARDYPLELSINANFVEITDADRVVAARQKTSEELQKEMMDAAMAGDMAKVEQLNQELAVVMRAQMEGAIGPAVSATPIQESEKPKKFHVQVIVNSHGESIAKEYDHERAGVTKAFRIDKGTEDYLSYRYYLGDWRVTELNKVNWRVQSPTDRQTAANHLRALVVQVNVYGDRERVEDYIDKHLALDKLISMVD